MRDTVRFISNYGPLKRGMEYKFVGEGRDYVIVKRGGSHIHVPVNLVAPLGYRFETYVPVEREEDEDEFAY